MMKKFFTLLYITTIIANTITTATAQNVKSDYFLHNSYSRANLNPALTPELGYVGIPGIADLNTGIFNSIELDNFIFNKNGQNVTFLHNSVTTKEALDKIPNSSNLDLNLSYTPLAVGFWDNKTNGFWNVSIALKANTELQIPKSLFKFLKEGGTSIDGETVKHNVKNLNVNANAYAEFAVGHAREIIYDKLTVGAKAKFLVGVLNADLNLDQLDITATKQNWTVKSLGTLNATGLKPKYKKENEKDIINSFDLDAGPNGYGAAVDLGAEYKVVKKLKVSLAVTDLGFIAWSKNKSVTLKTPNKEYDITIGSPDAVLSGNGNSTSFSEDIDDAVIDLREAVNFAKTDTKSQTNLLYFNVNAGAEYEIIPDLSAGILSTTRFAQQVETELTVSANYNPFKLQWLSAAASYSIVNTNYANLGLALHLAPYKARNKTSGKFQSPIRGAHIFLAADYILPKVNKQFLPTDTKSVNFQIGLAIPIEPYK